jgi:hypothetical protein
VIKKNITIGIEYSKIELPTYPERLNDCKLNKFIESIEIE